ncbi:hypothetical protein [Yoonia vestfoldensis]|jgi:uncharacterized membrane-anchored protein YitT (DUF2179 family)|uniref:Uncharacterized protein n=1 Tax=Yoonia vestfoldensis TaxID=245188 RepID=A0A1Y0EBY4_9RHOB|nr:hypothetical protein [Yoonia vestfoldensis]ARU01116.1 hypothetical protein LOKVESSMR4R_01803 [Yoonia vestfoldensis]
MTMDQVVLGAAVAVGFFLSAAVSRWFRRPVAGIIFGGVAGIALSVAILSYGLTEVAGRDTAVMAQ